MSFIPFDPNSDVIISSETLVSPAFTGGVYTLNSSSFNSSSLQEAEVSGEFYLQVYNGIYNASGSEVQFGIAYGHISGSGSAPFNGHLEENTPTRDIYGQYRNMIYGDEGSVFNFGGSNGNSKDIFVINFNRSRYKESFNLGSLNMKLVNNSASIYLTDDSGDSTVTNYINGNRYFNLVSGSNGRSYNTSSIQTNSGSYGYVYPDLGTIILNPRALAFTYANGGISMSLDETPSPLYTSAVNLNNKILFSALQKSGSLSLKSEETVTSKFFDVHVKYGQLNHTTNPSIIDNSGNLLYATLINNPQTYPTTIGLYNNMNELLAIAKLSKPLPKDYTKTLTLRVKLEF